MKGMSIASGKAIAGTAHLRQSITDILTTPLGSRVRRRTYGSRLFSLLDAPLHRNTVVDIIAATAEAIERWEPRLKLTSVRVLQGESPGSVQLDLEGEHRPTGTPVLLEGIAI